MQNINEIIATDVMNWKLDEIRFWRENGINTNLMCYPPHIAYKQCDNEYFRPDKNLKHTFLVIEKLKENNIFLTIEVEKEQYKIFFKHLCLDNSLQYVKYYCEYSVDFPTAICKMVLRLLKDGVIGV